MPKYKKEFGPYDSKPEMFRDIADWLEAHPAVKSKVTEETYEETGSNTQHYATLDYESDGYLDPIHVRLLVDLYGNCHPDPKDIYTDAFWECACERNCIHPVTQNECPVCLQEAAHGNDVLVINAIEYCEQLERDPSVSADEKAIIRDLLKKMLDKRPKYIRRQMVVEIICEDWFEIGDLLNANIPGLNEARDRTDLTLVEVPLPMIQDDWDKIEEKENA